MSLIYSYIFVPSKPIRSFSYLLKELLLDLRVVQKYVSNNKKVDL